MGKIRALVVEDSLTVRRRICEVLSSDPDLEVVGEAADGKHGVELCRELRPDVITLDMILPVMSGLTATEYIMAHFPTPILVVSSSTNRGELFKTYDALSAGAVDVLEKPRGDETDGSWEKRLISSVKMVSRIKVITHPRARLGSLGRAASEPWTPPVAVSTPRHTIRAIAIGASTGGPGAVVSVLRSIESGIGVPMFVVLHIDDPFATALAEWLDDQSSHRVLVPRGGESLESLAGRVVMAPSGKHLTVRDGAVRLTSDPERHSCRPSVDVLFESLAQSIGNGSVGCLLTGMGRDGASGLLAIRQAGGRTIAQDEATSVVFGMPKEAATLGAAEQVLPIQEIGAAITKIALESGRGST